jgi:hypothetical protein
MERYTYIKIENFHSEKKKKNIYIYIFNALNNGAPNFPIRSKSVVVFISGSLLS